MDGWMDTPQTVMTTRAPAVLTSQHTDCDCGLEKQNDEMPKYVESLIFPNRMQKDIKRVKVQQRGPVSLCITAFKDVSRNVYGPVMNKDY